METHDVGVVHAEVGVVGVEVAASGQRHIALDDAGHAAPGAGTRVLVNLVDPRSVEARGRRRPRDNRAVIVVVLIDPDTCEVRRGEAGDPRASDVDRRTGRIEPSGELEDRAVCHREVAAGPGDGEGELYVWRNRVRLRRNN